MRSRIWRPDIADPIQRLKMPPGQAAFSFMPASDASLRNARLRKRFAPHLPLAAGRAVCGILSQPDCRTRILLRPADHRRCCDDKRQQPLTATVKVLEQLTTHPRLPELVDMRRNAFHLYILR